MKKTTSRNVDDLRAWRSGITCLEILVIMIMSTSSVVGHVDVEKSKFIKVLEVQRNDGD